MLFTKLSLAENYYIVPGQGEFGNWHPGPDRKIANLFYSAGSREYRQGAHNIMESETCFFIIPTWFLAPIDCSKIPALDLEADANNIKSRRGSRPFLEKWNAACPGATENLHLRKSGKKEDFYLLSRWTIEGFRSHTSQQNPPQIPQSFEIYWAPYTLGTVSYCFISLFSLVSLQFSFHNTSFTGFYSVCPALSFTCLTSCPPCLVFFGFVLCCLTYYYVIFFTYSNTFFSFLWHFILPASTEFFNVYLLRVL